MESLEQGGLPHYQGQTEFLSAHVFRGKSALPPTRCEEEERKGQLMFITQGTLS